MDRRAAPTVHATAVVLGTGGALIRGPSGAGKSTLAHALVEAWRARGRFAAFVADDRVALSAHGGRLVARAPEALAGLAELAGRGILAVDHEPAAVIALVVDLVDEAAVGRMPDPTAEQVELAGVVLPRQAVPRRAVEVSRRLVEAALAAAEASPAARDSGECAQIAS